MEEIQVLDSDVEDEEVYLTRRSRSKSPSVDTLEEKLSEIWRDPQYKEILDKLARERVKQSSQHEADNRGIEMQSEENSKYKTSNNTNPANTVENLVNVVNKDNINNVNVMKSPSDSTLYTPEKRS